MTKPTNSGKRDYAQRLRAFEETPSVTTHEAHMTKPPRHENGQTSWNGLLGRSRRGKRRTNRDLYLTKNPNYRFHSRASCQNRAKS